MSAPAPTDHKDHVLKGIFFAVTAFFLFAVMSACAKILSEHHHVAEIAFYRNALFLVPMLIYMLARKDIALFKTKKPLGMFFRGAIGGVSLIVTYAAFAQLPMADTTGLLFASTLITPVLVHFILKEHVGIYRWSAVFIGLIGVILMASPTGAVNPLGVTLALSAACMHAMMFTALRYLKTENSLTVTFYFVLCGTIIGGLFMPLVAQVPQSPFELCLFGILGISGGTAQLCLTKAHRYAPASVVSPFNFTGLIWATLFDIALWAKIPGWPVWVGGTIIISASLFILYREHVNAAKPTS